MAKSWKAKRAQKVAERPWMSMILETNGEIRIRRDHPDVTQLLDYLQTKIVPFEGYGWTVFSDWLGTCYRRKFVEQRPENIPFVSQGDIYDAVFPTSRRIAS